MALCLLTIPRSHAADWPCWRGSQHDGISSETLEGATGLEQVWSAVVGGGHASVAVAAGRVYTLGRPDDGNEYVYCFHHATGKLNWKYSYPIEQTANDNNARRGPACTPAIDGDRVYTLGHGGELHCLDLGGQKKWSYLFPWGKTGQEDYGFSQSPLIVGDLVIINQGKRGTAFDKWTGRIVWGGDATWGACCAAVPYSDGVITSSWGGEQDQNVYVHGVDLKGNVQWTIPWRVNWGCLCASPIVRDGKLLLMGPTREDSLGLARYSFGAKQPDWSDRRTQSYTGQPLLLGELVYGICEPGVLFCIDWKSGETLWKQRGYHTRSALMAAGDTLIVQDGAGDLVLVATPSGKELMRHPEAVGDTYTAATYANGFIYCRDMEGKLVCFRVQR